MKDVVEAYESLFDKMKSSHNIEHLDSSLEDQEESKNSLEDTKDDSETATNENDNVLSKTRIPNSFSEFKSEFHGVSLFLSLFFLTCLDARVVFIYTCLVSFGLKSILACFNDDFFLSTVAQIRNSIWKVFQVEESKTSLETTEGNDLETENDTSETVINEDEDNDNDLLIGKNNSKVEIETMKKSLEEVTSENEKLKNSLEEANTRSQHWYHRSEQLTTENLDLESKLGESKALQSDQDEKIQMLENSLEDMKKELNDKNQEMKVLMKENEKNEDVFITLMVMFLIGIHLYIFGLYSFFSPIFITFLTLVYLKIVELDRYHMDLSLEDQEEESKTSLETTEENDLKTEKDASKTEINEDEDNDDDDNIRTKIIFFRVSVTIWQAVWMFGWWQKFFSIL